MAKRTPRGALSNPEGRFERLRVDLELSREHGFGPAPDDEAATAPQTVYLRDPTRQILAKNQSPDVPFDVSVNPYRGCTHGCVYCFARPTHEYLGFSAGLDFETRILVKDDAPKLLRKALLSPRHEPRLLGLSGVTDPYQPVEAKLRITRGILEVLAEFRHPVGVITKNFLVTRDVDLLAELAEHRAVSVKVSITTLDASLQRKMEPGTSRPSRRLAAVERLAAAGVPVGVMVAPIIPGLTDHEVPAILQAAADAGADSAGRVLLRLPHGLKALFEEWLEAHFPDRRAKVMNRMLALHDGQLYRPGFGVRQRGGGVYAYQITAMFDLARRKAGLAAEGPGLSAAAFRRPGAQLALFQ
ncbi:MAG: PA0069 family radical SAM protein [Myxococcales bacterium]|nr:PA0069 family radical SAM protein [Myxococcales bacterium]